MFGKTFCLEIVMNLRKFGVFAEVAEAKFKEIMTSYEAIKSERKNSI